MLPLWDMIAKAQNGQASDLIARQFALSQAQTQAAVDALLPAFSQALKRKAANDPFGLGAFMTAAAGGAYAKYFEDASRAFTPEGMAAGNALLEQIFGSKELSQAIAAQAAKAAGLGTEIVKQMMPALAAVMSGGFFKQFTGALPEAGGANPFAEFFAALSRQDAAPTAPPADAAAAPGADPLTQAWAASPWNKALAGMWTPGDPQPAGADNPFGRMVQQWAMLAQPAPAPSAPQPGDPFAQAFGRMFETGRKSRDDYLKSMDALFDRFAKTTKPN